MIIVGYNCTGIFQNRQAHKPINCNSDTPGTYLCLEGLDWFQGHLQAKYARGLVDGNAGELLV